MGARVIVLAGPSGSGKSRLAARLGWPALRLDDFYREIHDADMPRTAEGAVDWDDVGSWDLAAAIVAIESLCDHGTAFVPSYDIARSMRTGSGALVATDLFVAEGLFAPEIATACRERGLLAAAICVRHNRFATFMLRLVRDLREGRKSSLVLVRRGLRLLRAEPDIVAHAVAHGCVPMTPRQAERSLRVALRRGRRNRA